MTPLYILGGFPYEATPSRKHGVIFRLVKAARRKPSPGQMTLFDMPSKPKAPKRNKAKEGDTRINRAGNKEVLRSSRWRLLEPKVKRPKAGLRMLSDDAIAATKQPLTPRDEDIFEPNTNTPLTDDIDYAYNRSKNSSRSNKMAFRKIEPGLYESDTHRIFLNRKDHDWVLIDKATRKVLRGIGTLKHAKQWAASLQED